MGFMFGFMDAAFPVMFMLVFCLVFGTIVFTLIGSLRQWNKDNHSPKLTVPATVVGQQEHRSRFLGFERT